MAPPRCAVCGNHQLWSYIVGEDGRPQCLRCYDRLRGLPVDLDAERRRRDQTSWPHLRLTPKEVGRLLPFTARRPTPG